MARLSISGRTSWGCTPVTALTTAAAAGVWVAASLTGLRATPISSAIRQIISPYDSTSAPTMSNDRPAAAATLGARARYSMASRSSIGAVRLSRQVGNGTRRRRSTSRTRILNESERAPITIEARKATESGSPSSRIRSTSSRDAMWRDTSVPGGGAMPPR